MTVFGHALRIGATAAFAALMSPPAAAGPDADPPAPRGDYVFATFAQKDDHRACTEHWQFDDSSTVIIHSGPQIVAVQYSFERYQGGQSPLYLMVTKTISSNGRPDCLGNIETATGEVSRLVVYRGHNGGIVLCGRPEDGPAPPDDAPMVLHPFARLDPVPDSDKPQAAPGGN
jgi:hypothetical protein